MSIACGEQVGDIYLSLLFLSREPCCYSCPELTEGFPTLVPPLEEVLVKTRRPHVCALYMRTIAQRKLRPLNMISEIGSHLVAQTRLCGSLRLHRVREYRDTIAPSVWFPALFAVST